MQIGTSRGPDEGLGLAKIATKHPEGLSVVQNNFAGLNAIPDGNGGRELNGNGYRAVVRSQYNGQPKSYLMTAYKSGAPSGRISAVPGSVAEATSGAPIPNPTPIGAPNISVPPSEIAVKSFTPTAQYVLDQHAKTVMDATRNEDGSLFQGKKASVAFGQDGSTVVRALQNPDVSSAVHELGHMIRRDMTPEDLKAVEDHFGIDDGLWTRDHEESFAESFENYLMTGRAPTLALAPVFQRVADWMRNLYHGIKGTPLETLVHPQLRDVFDRSLGKGREVGQNASEDVGGSSVSKLSATSSDPSGASTNAGSSDVWARHDPYGYRANGSADDYNPISGPSIPKGPLNADPLLWRNLLGVDGLFGNNASSVNGTSQNSLY